MNEKPMPLPHTTPPNILWITTDQQRYDTVHALGNPHIRTPNLDRLCTEGTAFTHAYCQSPICTPSRASFLTGLHPSTVHANINGNDRFHTDDRIRLITRRLADVEYDCGLAGKLHLASAWNGVEQRCDDGYRAFHYSHSPATGRGIGNAYMEWLESIGRFDDVFTSEPIPPDAPLPGGRHDGRRYTLRPDMPAELHQTTWCADRAIDFMREKRVGPWLMSVNIFDPHPPFDAPAKYADRYDAAALPPPLFRESDLAHQARLEPHFFQGSAVPPGAAHQRIKANYYGMIELIDAQVGRMLDALESTGQRANTLVIFTSDHGEMLGDHGLTAKGCRFHEGLVRVPLILSWPGHFASGVRSDALVELTDLAPTLGDVAGIEQSWTHGASLLPILNWSQPAFQPHDYVRCEYYDTLNMQAPGGDPTRHRPSHATMFRDARWKLNVYHGTDYGELYDLDHDPDEFVNLWEAPEAQTIKHRLIKQSFDASIVITDPGARRIGRY